jgi:hypothetical protein
LLTLEAFDQWLAGYKTAWETRSPDAVGRLFAEDGLYYIKPFDQPLRGRDAIVDYWRGVERTQAEVQFTYTVLAVREAHGLAHWSARFRRVKGNKPVQLDGILLAELNPANQCICFREWWHSRR